MVSAAAFGAGLSNYPQNFVTNGAFDGQVVVGAAAAAIDSTSAQSIINDLAAEFSGNSEKVMITYRKSTAGGEEMKLADSSSTLNYGEAIGEARSQKIDKGDLDVLADETFSNGADDQDYKQEVQFSNTAGVFERSLRTSADQTDISNHIYINDNVDFFTYTLDMNSPVNYGTAYTSQSQVDDDFVGETLTILGAEYTVTTFNVDVGNTDKVTKLELIGGANKVSLGEGESTTVSINGKSYEVSIQSVSDTKVLLTVNGQSKSISLLY
jgi:hypothetical protein